MYQWGLEVDWFLGLTNLLESLQNEGTALSTYKYTWKHTDYNDRLFLINTDNRKMRWSFSKNEGGRWSPKRFQKDESGTTDKVKRSNGFWCGVAKIFYELIFLFGAKVFTFVLAAWRELWAHRFFLGALLLPGLRVGFWEYASRVHEPLSP